MGTIKSDRIIQHMYCHTNSRRSFFTLIYMYIQTVDSGSCLDIFWHMLWTTQRHTLWACSDIRADICTGTCANGSVLCTEFGIVCVCKVCMHIIYMYVCICKFAYLIISAYICASDIIHICMTCDMFWHMRWYLDTLYLMAGDLRTRSSAVHQVIGGSWLLG